MSAADARRDDGSREHGASPAVADPHRLERASPSATRYGTIVVVGGGCYGSYYLRQLRRARAAGALTWSRLLVVDRDPDCRAAREASGDAELLSRGWREFFSEFLAAADVDPSPAAPAAIVPSPLMPHLLFDWVVDRARARWPLRRVAVEPLGHAPEIPWQRVSPDGDTHYVSFAEWMCPINCIEPVRCPATRGVRGWTMPRAVAEYVDAERSRGHVLDGPFVFHCTHRAYGVGMIDASAVVDADRAIRALGDGGPVDALLGTMSHCHGALGRLTISRL